MTAFVSRKPQGAWRVKPAVQLETEANQT